MHPNQLTVLIGSFARGTEELHSDIDVVRVGHRKRLSKSKIDCLARSKAPISYVDYEPETFASLYKSGSLFIHHVLTEGRLLQGSELYWTELCRDFVVTTDFSALIFDHLVLSQWLARSSAFSNAVMPQLSHMFRALKNAAIFSLAQEGVFVYDKRKALRRAFTFLTRAEIDVLLDANNSYDRGTEGSLTLAQLADFAPRLSSKIHLASGRLLANARTRNSF